MTNNDDDTQELIRRLEREMGRRRDDADDDAERTVYDERHPFPQPEPPPEQEPQRGEARPVAPPPEPQRIQIRLPLSNGWAYKVLLAINIAVFIVPTVLQMAGVQLNGEPINNYVLDWGAKSNIAISQFNQYYRFLTAMFLHGGWLHIAFNAYALYILGPQTESLYGTARFLALYFITGFAGGVASYAFSPAPSVGASGAVFGLIGGLAAFFYINRRTLGDMARQQLGGLVTVIMLNLFIGFSAPNIDNFAHLGGLFGGIVVGALLAPRYNLDERLYPPVIARNDPPIGWVGAAGVFVILVMLMLRINPPLR